MVLLENFLTLVTLFGQVSLYLNHLLFIYYGFQFVFLNKFCFGVSVYVCKCFSCFSLAVGWAMHLPFIPALWMQRQVDLWVLGQPGLTEWVLGQPGLHRETLFQKDKNPNPDDCYSLQQLENSISAKYVYKCLMYINNIIT